MPNTRSAYAIASCRTSGRRNFAIGKRLRPDVVSPMSGSTASIRSGAAAKNHRTRIFEALPVLIVAVPAYGEVEGPTRSVRIGIIRHLVAEPDLPHFRGETDLLCCGALANAGDDGDREKCKRATIERIPIPLWPCAARLCPWSAICSRAS